MSDCNRRQLSSRHMEILAQFMERLRPLALATDRSRKGHAKARWMWDKIARHLNSVDGKVAKTGKNWARYWIDLKFKLRRKHALIRRCEREGRRCLLQLSPYEERLMKILTDDEGNLLGCTTVHGNGGEHSNDSSLNYYTEDRPMPTERVNILEDNKLDPADNTEDPIEDTKNAPGHIKNDPEDTKRTLERMKRKYYEFELIKQRELFEIEKEQRRERHKLEIEILNLKKQILKKELFRLQNKK